MKFSLPREQSLVMVFPRKWVRSKPFGADGSRKLHALSNSLALQHLRSSSGRWASTPLVPQSKAVKAGEEVVIAQSIREGIDLKLPH
jgi:hypothetical protein